MPVDVPLADADVLTDVLSDVDAEVLADEAIVVDIVELAD